MKLRVVAIGSLSCVYPDARMKNFVSFRELNSNSFSIFVNLGPKPMAGKRNSNTLPTSCKKHQHVLLTEGGNGGCILYR